jgi:hypothetical protein
MSRRRSIALLDVVEVLKDRADTPVLSGAQGTVVDIDAERYWVEFAGPDGETIALVSYAAAELKVVWSADSRSAVARGE